MSGWVIADLNFAELSLWRVELKAGPVVFKSFCAAIGSIAQNELVLKTGYFIDRNKVVIEVEFFDGWEVSVLLVTD